METRKETDKMLKKAGRLISLFLFVICVFAACGSEEILLEYDIMDSADLSGAENEENSLTLQEENKTVFVHVCGAVVAPGVYELPDGSRVCDAVEAAGGFDEIADTESVNLVELLEDSEQIRIAYIGENEAEDSGLIDINQADVSLLCEIPGIGESRAEAIVSYREEYGKFTEPEELMQVPGIKEGLFAKMLPYIECK